MSNGPEMVDVIQEHGNEDLVCFFSIIAGFVKKYCHTGTGFLMSRRRP